MIAIAITARFRGLPKGRAVALVDLPAILGRAAIPMTLPVVLLGGLFSGIFTPTEAAAVAALYAIALGVLVYRNLGLRTLVAVMLESARQSAVVMVLIASAFVVNYAITTEQIAQRLADAVMAWQLGPIAFLLAVNGMFLVLGCVLDASVLLLVFVPVLLPAAKALGLDLVHFGVVVIVNLMIGLVTPPYGLLLFVLSALGRVPLIEIIREIWIFIVPLTAVLLLLIAVPDLVLALPRWAGMVK
jgi:tripartite ATP-independent transporter DctM subunit